jgi:hypothetical protein
MKKQLIVTLAFLIVSVSVLGMASYAWYSNNTVAKATGMAVSVVMPINVMASLDAPESVTSLEGFTTYFEFGSSDTLDGQLQISEYDMLVPVTCSDGMNFAYLPFRYVGADGCPKAGTTLSDYQIIPETVHVGYFIDIPLHITTTTPLDLKLYVKYINISDPMGDNAITGAVRCAVITKNEGSYRKVFIAKDSSASPLVSGDGLTTYYPMICDGTNISYASSDTASFESEYYVLHPEINNPYVPTAENSFLLRASETVGNVTTYYTTEVRLRLWVEGTDRSAVFSNAGAYFTVSVVLAVEEN